MFYCIVGADQGQGKRIEGHLQDHRDVTGTQELQLLQRGVEPLGKGQDQKGLCHLEEKEGLQTEAEVTGETMMIDLRKKTQKYKIST